MGQEYRSNLDELKALSKKLEGLLENPQPGLSTWLEQLADVTDEIAKFAPRYPFQLMDEVRKNGNICSNDEIVRLVNKKQELAKQP